MTFNTMQLLAIATGLSSFAFLLSGALLIAFRRGRLRTFNIVVVFVLAAFAGVYYLKFGARMYEIRLELAAWTAMLVCAGYGLLGMARIARTDRPVWDKRGLTRKQSEKR